MLFVGTSSDSDIEKLMSFSDKLKSRQKSLQEMMTGKNESAKRMLLESSDDSSGTFCCGDYFSFGDGFVVNS